MISRPELGQTQRAMLDRSISGRRRQIAEMDLRIRALKQGGPETETMIAERSSLVAARSSLSAEQGYDTAAARRDDKTRLKEVRRELKLVTRAA